jgi:hypothetical protein
MTPPLRRYAGDAGASWRKWQGPQIEYAPFWRRYPFGFWAFCIAVGLLAGAIVGSAPR